MNFPPVNAGALYRAALSVSVAALLAACAGGPSAGSSPDVFDLSDSERQSRFPKRHSIGVVELSGARVQARPFKGFADEKEYLATGGAFLIKRLASPILAQAPEILVTPEAAVLKGPDARVRQDKRLVTGAGADTEITIDGPQIKIKGPHIIRDLATGKVSLMGGAKLPETAPAPAPEAAAAPAPAPVQPVKTTPAASPRKEAPTVVAPAPAPARPAVSKPAPAPIKNTVAKPQTKPASTASSAPAAKPATQPKAAPKPKPAPQPEVNTQAVRSLMREPSE